MRNVPVNLFMLLLALTAFSCQKELSFENTPGSNNPASLLGNWNFHGLEASVESASSFNLGGVPGKIVATYHTTTQNNKGTLTVTSGTMNTTNLGYKIAADVKVITYGGGQIIDEQDEHIDFDLSSSSASSDYQQIGSDSLYFPNGFMWDIPDTNGQQLDGASDPAGARFRISGDTLVIQSAVSRSATTTQNGMVYTVSHKVDGTFTFIRP